MALGAVARRLETTNFLGGGVGELNHRFGDGLNAGAVPLVIILEANNIIFPKVLTILYFDDHQVDHARVLQTVGGALGDIGRLVAG